MKLHIIMGDITLQRSDAIVNAANTSLLGGGGVDGAIHRAAGPGLLAECKTLGGCDTGEVKATKGYNLAAKYIMHTPGPIWRGGGYSEEELLANCYKNSLRLAESLGCKSVSFPSISTGVYRFPLEQAAKIAVAAILEYAKEPELKVEDVYMVCFSEEIKNAYDRALADAR